MSNELDRNAVWEKSKSNGFKNFAYFETLITPRIIVAVYWILTVIYLCVAVYTLTQTNFMAFGIDVLILIVTRISFELIMVSFKNNEFLFRICNALEKDKQ